MWLGDATQAPVAPGSQDIVLQSTVFSSLLDDAFQQRLADTMWRWLKPGGAVLWYDFTVNNPRNPDVRGVPLARVRAAVSARPRRRPARDAGAAAGARACAAGTRRLYSVLQRAAAAAHASCWPGCASPERTPSADNSTWPQTSSPFALPEIGDEEIAEVVDTLRTGWVTTGPKARRFEQDFAAFLGRRRALHCVAVNSATAGLHLALEALGIGPGDEVITTTHTFTATAEVVRYLGADVKLVDIDPATLNIDPAAVEAAITPRTKAIMPVHYAGLAADMPAHPGHRPPPRPEGGGGRRPRPAHHLRRPARRHAGQRRHGVQLLRQQDHHHRRRRHAGDARRGAGRSAPAPCACTA